MPRKKKGDCVNFSHGDSRSQKLHRLLKIKFDASCLIILFPARENKINAGVGQWNFFSEYNKAKRFTEVTLVESRVHCEGEAAAPGMP